MAQVEPSGIGSQPPLSVAGGSVPEASWELASSELELDSPPELDSLLELDSPLELSLVLVVLDSLLELVLPELDSLLELESALGSVMLVSGSIEVVPSPVDDSLLVFVSDAGASSPHPQSPRHTTPIDHQPRRNPMAGR